MSSHILAEVDQLADRIGIIHDGTLIEELERGEAGSRKRMCVEIEADAPERAEAVLRESLGLREIKRAPEGALEQFCGSPTRLPVCLRSRGPSSALASASRGSSR